MYRPPPLRGRPVLADKKVLLIDHDCNAAYSSGTLFRQTADLSAGETAQAVMSSSTAATATGRIKYRLSAGNAQAAGAYTTLITYTIYAAY